MNLEEAKQLLRDNWQEGIECPCCRQYVKLYKRKLNSAMAYVLVMMDRAPTGYFHVENWLKTQNTPASLRGDFPKLHYWGLIEAKEATREDGSPRVGYYRITEKGRKFVHGLIEVPARAQLFNQKFYGYDGDPISIKQALGDKFNYEELMGSKGQWL